MNTLSQYGIWGIIIGGLAIYILMLEKKHYKERTEWRETIRNLFDKQDKQVKDTNEIIISTIQKTNQVIADAAEKTSTATNRSGNILEGLKTLIETLRRDK